MDDGGSNKLWDGACVGLLFGALLFIDWLRGMARLRSTTVPVTSTVRRTMLPAMVDLTFYFILRVIIINIKLC